MASNLLNIGSTGIRAAQAALSVTGQNIANANNADYTRRRLDVAEMTANGGIGQIGDKRLSGVRIEGIGRTASAFLSADMRRTGSNLARADAQLGGLLAAERSVEQSGIYPALVEFEVSLARLASDPLSTPLRVEVLESARSAAAGFGLTAQGLENAMGDAAFAAGDAVTRANGYAAELARINNNLARSQEGSAGRASLLDQRDALLADLSGIAGISTSFDDAGRTTVRLGDNSGPVMVQGETAAALAVAVDADGRLSFDLGGTAVTPVTGTLAGQSLALDRMANLRGELDSVAAGLISAVNTAQANGVAPSGAPGQPLFSGAGAADIAVTLGGPGGIATASAGSPAGSRDTGNLTALQSALAADGGPTSEMDGVLFGLSSEIANRRVTQGALETIAESAAAALASETAVDLDEEAANLVRFQQAFQASGRVIQAAADIFDTILGVR